MINMHKFDKDLIQRLYDSRVRRIKNLMASAEVKGSIFPRLALVATEIMGYSFALNNKQNISQEYVEIAKDTLVGNFALAVANEEFIDVKLGQSSFRLESRVNNQRLDTFYWRTAFFLALICRDNEALKVLLSVPDDLLLSQGEGDEFNITYVHFIKALMGHGKNAGELLLKASKQMDIDYVTIADKDWVELLEQQQSYLWASLLSNENEEFGEEEQ